MRHFFYFLIFLNLPFFTMNPVVTVMPRKFTRNEGVAPTQRTLSELVQNKICTETVNVIFRRTLENQRPKAINVYTRAVFSADMHMVVKHFCLNFSWNHKIKMVKNKLKKLCKILKLLSNGNFENIFCKQTVQTIFAYK